MANVVVVGSQWGDEGKGKIVDWLSSRAEVVVRFQGGHNAGHTLVVDGTTYKLSLLPSGVVRGGKLSVIGNGVVLDPWAFLAEVERIKEQGVKVNPENLLISESAALILPIHSELDGIRENRADGIKIGTTKRGIGPAYEDKVARRAIRVCDLADESHLLARVENLLHHHNALRRGLGQPETDAQELYAKLLEAIITGGITGISLTKLDVLDGFAELKICVGYKLDGKILKRLPAGAANQAAVEPIYESMPGWQGSTRGARSWADLPAEAVKYVRRVEELIGCPVSMVSTSPEREDVILMRDPFKA